TGGVAGELDDHHLQAEAESEARDVLLAGEAGGGHLALHPPLAEAAGDDDAVEVLEAAFGEETLDVLGLDPLDVDLGAMVVAAVSEGFDDREVGVRQAVLHDE